MSISENGASPKPCSLIKWSKKLFESNIPLGQLNERDAFAMAALTSTAGDEDFNSINHRVVYAYLVADEMLQVRGISSDRLKECL